MQKLIFAFILCVAVADLQAQGFTSMDAVAFCRGSDSVQVEVYYSVLQKLLPFKHTGSTWSAPINGAIEIYQDDKLLKRTEIHKEKTFNGTEAEFKQHIADDLVDGAYFMVAPKANTMAVLILTGLNDTKSSYNDTIRRTVALPIRKPNTYQFATIEFASAMEKTADKTEFFEKAGFRVIPNPSFTFGGNFTKLYAYSELNVPTAEINANNIGTVRISVVDATGHEMYHASEEVTLDAPIVPVISSAEIEGLPTDSYLFQLSLIRNGVAVDSASKQFYYDSGIELSDDEQAPATSNTDEATLYQLSDLSRLGDLEVEERAAQTLYGALANDKVEYSKLPDLDSRRHWLFSYWRLKDKEAGAKPLTSYRQFLRRVDEANQRFTSMKTPGWKTSRGRIWIQYGRPDQITSDLFGVNSKPYIQWEYTGQKIPLQSGSRGEFVFVDKFGGGNFILVSSNAIGEVQENDWFTREAVRTVGN